MKTGGKNRPCHMRKILLRTEIAYFLPLRFAIVSDSLNSFAESLDQEYFVGIVALDNAQTL